MKFYFNYFFLFILGLWLKITSLGVVGNNLRKTISDEAALSKMFSVAYNMRMVALMVLFAMLINLFLEWRERKLSKKKMFLLSIFPLFLLLLLGIST